MHEVAVASAFVFLVSFMASVGLHIAPGMMASELARPSRLLRGLGLTLIVVPIVTLVVLRALGATGAVAVGLVLIAVSPGPPLASSTAKKVEGDVPLALAMTVVLGIVTAFTAAPSARWMLAYHGQVDVRPPSLVAKLFLLQLLPLAAGALVRRYAPTSAPGLMRVMNVVVAVSALVLIVTAIAPIIPRLGIVGWDGLAAILLTMVAAVPLGWLAGGHDKAVSRTLAATVSVPNVGLAVAIAKAAHAPKVVLPTIAAIFVVRVLCNLLVVRVLRRRSTASGRTLIVEPPSPTRPTWREKHP
jgi:BASS family bile acid:Na+ symporter